MPREKSAGAIIYRIEGGEPQYLLLRYQSGHWEFAKGHIEEGESNEETVRREIKEETGITDIELTPGFKEHIKYFFRNNYDLKKKDKSKAPWIFKLVVFYLAATREKEVRLSHEHSGFVWLPYQEALKKLTFKNAKAILAKANDLVSSKGVSGR
jgi:8-oxo-dGTP pyrophosphatase MutT (NUDIX family)